MSFLRQTKDVLLGVTENVTMWDWALLSVFTAINVYSLLTDRILAFVLGLALCFFLGVISHYRGLTDELSEMVDDTLNRLWVARSALVESSHAFQQLQELIKREMSKSEISK